MSAATNRWIWLTIYVACIVGANWFTSVWGLVPIGLGLSVTAGTFAAGLALVARDGVQVTSGKAWTLIAIIAGAGLSWITSSSGIALASGLAFLVSEFVDFAVFTPLSRSSTARAVIVSSIVSAPVDTLLFLVLAGFAVTWQAVAGQFIVKTLVALVAATYLGRRA